MKKIKFNLNCFVKVKLTDYGKNIYYHQYDEINKIIPTKHKIKPQMPEIDKKGYYKTLLWQLMELYGPHITLGAANVFDTEIILLKE